MVDYSQGVCADGAAILKDGQQMTVEEILAELRVGDSLRAELAERENAVPEDDEPVFSVFITEDELSADYQLGVYTDRAQCLPLGHHDLYTHPPRQAVPEAHAFGSGDKVVQCGTYGRKRQPAVFVRPAQFPGEPGQSAEREPEDSKRLLPGEWVMTFPTMKQAKSVYAALMNRLTTPPPAPSVPDAYGGTNDSPFVDSYNSGWDACIDAMKHGFNRHDWRDTDDGQKCQACGGVVSTVGEDWCEMRPLTATPAHPPAPSVPDDAEDLAKAFHDAYERWAPEFGYETRAESAVPWEDVPEPNKSLMIAAAGEVLTATPAPSMEEQCEDDLRKVMGMYPHNHPGNICHADPYFSKAIDRKYPAEMIERITDRLRSEGRE